MNTLPHPPSPRKQHKINWTAHGVAWNSIAASHSDPAVRQWAAKRAAYCRRKAAQS